MSELNALAASQLDDPYYLKEVTELGDARPIMSNRDIHSTSLNPYVGEENFLGIQEGSRACFDAKILLDETLWQFHSLSQEIRWRWPVADTEGSGAVAQWIKEVEALL